MALVVLIVTAGTLGRWIGRALRLPNSRAGWLYAWVLGLCGCAILTAAAGAVSIEAAFWLLAVIAVSGIVQAGWEWKRATRTGLAEYEREHAALRRLAMAALVTAFSCAFVSSLAPLTSWDAATAHLSLPKDYVREGRMLLIEGNAYSAYPHLIHTLFTLTFFHGGETGAQLLNLLLGAAACGFLYILARRLAGPSAGWIAAATLACAPIFMDQAGAASLDLAFGGFITGALAALLAAYAKVDDSRRLNPRWIIAAALLAGSACGIRHTGYLTALLLNIGVLVFSKGNRWRDSLTFTTFTLLAAAPWLLRSAVLTGNPVYPFMTQWFPNGGVADLDVTAVGVHESLQLKGLSGLLQLPWTLVMQPDRFDGWTKSPGPLVLALGVPGIFFAGRDARRLAFFAIAGGLCLYFFRQYARYYLPFFIPMMAVAAAMAVSPRMPRRLTLFLLAIAYAYGLVLAGAAIHFKLPVVLGMESRNDYLLRRVERYPAFQWANENIPHDETILTLDMRSYYFDGRSYQNREALQLLTDLPIEAQMDWLQKRGIRYVFFPDAYIAESPGFAEHGLTAMFDGWRRDARFEQIQQFDLAQPRADGVERVEIYAVDYDGDPAER